MCCLAISHDSLCLIGEESTGTWLAVKSAFGRLLAVWGAFMKVLPTMMPQTTMTPDGPLEMNRCSLELPSDCSFDLSLSWLLVVSFSCLLTDLHTH